MAPKQVLFYDGDWNKMGTRATTIDLISDITGISQVYLGQRTPLRNANIAQRMSWASRRLTTSVEDMAYCMLGMFDLNMPLLYGEGPKAFVRLQEELIKVSNEHTIFCWSWRSEVVPSDWTSMLSPSPLSFQYSGNIV